MPKVLVTGGCGYIGSHTLVELLAAGHEPISMDDNSRSSESILDGVERIAGKRVRNHKVDLCNAPLTEAVFAEHRDAVAVIHFAAFKTVPESVAKPLLYYDNNVNSLLNVLSFTDKYQIPYFIFSSSCSVYGNASESPKSEVRTSTFGVRHLGELPATEDTPFGEPECPYARTKQMGEHIIGDFAKVSETGFVSLRYFNPVGAHPSGEIGEVPYGEPDNLVPRITRTAYASCIEHRASSLVVHGNDYDTRDGTCIRDYIHVSDIARAHVLAIDYLRETRDGGRETGKPVSRDRNSPPRHEIAEAGTKSEARDQNAECRSPDTANCELETGNSRRSRVGLGGFVQTFNLGSGTGTTVLEAIAAFERATGRKLNYRIGPRRAGDAAAVYADNRKAGGVLGWRPAFGIDEMMRTAWVWEQRGEGKGKGEGKGQTENQRRRTR